MAPIFQVFLILNCCRFIDFQWKYKIFPVDQNPTQNFGKYNVRYYVKLPFHYSTQALTPFLFLEDIHSFFSTLSYNPESELKHI